MTRSARIRNLQLLRGRGGNELNMRADVDVGDGLLDLRHVAA